jgi:histidinol-phosphate aminotransferase
MSELFRSIVPENVQKLRPYQPGKPVEELERELGITGAIKIASNENPLGPSPRAIEAARRAVAGVHFYPDDCFQLRRELSMRLGVGPSELCFGAGSEEIIHMVVQAFCRPKVDQVLTHQYAFISYRLAAQVRDVPLVEAPVTDDLRCDVDALIDRIDSRTRVIFLATPNNPTGAHLERAELERLLDALPERTLLVVDEAYHEYARAGDPDYPSSQGYRLGDRRGILTLRTFSKVYGLAGLRVGYAVGDPEICGYIDRVRRPFNVSSVAQAAALAALGDDEHVRRSTEAATAGIAALRSAVEALGLRSYPSLANFVLVDVGQKAEPVYEALLQRGVIVRPMGAWGLDRCVRISVGTPEQTERACLALADVLAPRPGHRGP